MRKPSYLIPIILLAVLTAYHVYMLSAIDLSQGMEYGVKSIYWLGLILMMWGGYYRLRYGDQHPVKRSKSVNFLISWATLWLFLLIVVGVVVLFYALLVGAVDLIDQIAYEGRGVVSLRSPIVIIGIYTLALVFLVLMIYGVLWGKYKFRVAHISIAYNALPSGFDGFRIVQISDIHAGTWDDVKSVERGVNMIQDQRGDMIVFTGDLVNRDKDEIDPFLDLFASLDAPYGKYAILGNHDYYGQPRDRALRSGYYAAFFEKYNAMGWDLLRNESRTIKRQGDRISLLGVENWGAGRYFPKRGDLTEALEGVNKRDFCILLSHDPTHWDHSVLPHQRHIPLTLSGHTHGMQFGINWKKLRWSPAQWRYKRWMGLYEEGQQYLYVNRGLGCLALAARIGMWPEITVITLRSR